MWGRGVLASFGTVSADAAKLTFPLQLVIVIIGGIVATTGAFWISTAQIRGDVQAIKQHLDDQARIDELERKLQEERNDAMKSSITEIKASLKLEEIRNQEMRVTIAGITGAKK